jgi:putative transcriptional regulator
MSDEHTVRARRLPDGRIVQVMPDGSTRPFDGRSDWDRIMAMTDEEIEANARSDPDNPPLTADELARLRPALTPKAIRERLDMSQEAFAARFAIPLESVRAWERGDERPTGAARTLLRVIAREPEAVLRALAS